MLWTASAGLERVDRTNRFSSIASFRGLLLFQPFPINAFALYHQGMDKQNILVAYFSRKNTDSAERSSTEIVASVVSKLLGATQYEICTLSGYPEDADECNKIAKKERDENARPELRNQLPDMNGIAKIVLVYPNWWGDLPMAVYSFLDKIDTENLDIYPVCTHEDNGLAMTERILAQSYPKANVQKGVAIRGSVAHSSPFQTENTIEKYLTDRALIK